MKVALICPTIGQTRRGYERYFGNLFRFLSPHVEITLFKGGGEPSAKERVIRHLARTGILSRLFPNRFLYTRYRLEFASFMIMLAPHLVAGGYDLVHFIDPPLARPLAGLRRWTGAGFKILFSDGGPVSQDCTAWADHTHVMNPHDYESVLSKTGSRERVTLISPGVDPAPLDAVSASRADLRAKWNVPPDTFVALSVTTINRGHKRVDHLIREAAGVPGNLLLWLDGGLHPDGEPALIDMGRQALGARFRHTHVDSSQVAELYKLADVVVSSATHETFGIAIAEAICCGVPTITHDSPHFRWLAGSGGHFVDMNAPGRLRELLQRLAENRSGLFEGLDFAAQKDRFVWPVLWREYHSMYRAVTRTS